jgi:hypothetical protein
VVDCAYSPDTDGLSQHRMFRVDMTLKAATDEPFETLTQADIMGSLRDMIEERTAEVIGWSTKDPMATTDGEAKSHDVSTELTISSCRRADCENPDTPFVSEHRIEGVMIVDTDGQITPDQGWILGRGALAFEVANAVAETIAEATRSQAS